MQQAKQEAADAEAEAVSGGEAAEVEGFIFSRLIERHADSRSELLTFREALLASTNQEQTLKVCHRRTQMHSVHLVHQLCCLSPRGTLQPRSAVQLEACSAHRTECRAACP